MTEDFTPPPNASLNKLFQNITDYGDFRFVFVQNDSGNPYGVYITGLNIGDINALEPLKDEIETLPGVKVSSMAIISPETIKETVGAGELPDTMVAQEGERTYVIWFNTDRDAQNPQNPRGRLGFPLQGKDR